MTKWLFQDFIFDLYIASIAELLLCQSHRQYLAKEIKPTFIDCFICNHVSNAIRYLHFPNLHSRSLSRHKIFYLDFKTKFVLVHKEGIHTTLCNTTKGRAEA